MLEDLTGHTIKGYELHDLIGAGGFGAVYRAFQPLLRRDVAMKIILPEYANHPEFIRRFEFEAQLVARLEHIHIVALYDYWREPDGAFLIMRWLRGGSLRGMLKRERIDNETTVRLTDQICAALAAAHRRGVVHRDIKPDNILFDDDQNAYLADFGIAKDLRETTYEEEHSAQQESERADDSALTGSPFYLSPEQAQSQPISPQADIYSMGIVMYEILTGQPPFAGDKNLMEILLHHINDPLPPLAELRPDLPPEVDTVLQRATAKDPLSRHQDALNLAVDFRRAMTGGEQVVPGASPQPVEVGGDIDDVLIITRPISPATLVIVPDSEIANPYKGLQAFEEADAEDFFGREMLIERLMERLAEPGDISRFLAVIGPSGSGKSSVVKAGLIPALRRGALPGSDQWYYVEMVPSTDPFRELASALLGVAVDPPEGLVEKLRTDEAGLVWAIDQVLPDQAVRELVLTIDQFEEVFTMLGDEAARAHFLQLLLLAVADPNCPLRLIVTLRADFYDRPLLYPGFGEMVRRRNEVVLPLTTDEMREAIVGPAERAGLTVESGLVAAIVSEVGGQPGGLPLLQYALTEVFERRDGNALTVEAYHESGGVLGALARRAEEVFQETSETGQAVMRQVFLRLVNVGEGTDDTRRRVLQSELMALAEDADQVNDVIDHLGRYRLLTFDHDPDTRAPVVAIAHEALIREWSRLRNWLDDNREDLLLQRRMAQATAEWHNLNRDASFLASGTRLAQFEELLAGGTLVLTPEEVEYVEASVQRREKLAAEAAAREARERELEQRSRDRMRALAVVAGIAAVVTSVLALLAFFSFREAEDQRENADNQRVTAVYNAEVADEQRAIAEDRRIEAERQAEINQSLALIASARNELAVSKDPDLALALALEANRIDDPPAQVQFELGRIALAPGTRRVLAGHESYVASVDAHPDGERAISSDAGGVVIVWNWQTGEILQQIQTTEAGWTRAVRFSPDGSQFLTGTDDPLVKLWDTETGELLMEMAGHEGNIRAVRFNPVDPTRAFSASEDNTVIEWDLTTGEMVQKFEGHEDTVRGLDVSPDGTTILTGSYDSTVKLWDVETGEELNTFIGHEGRIAEVTYSPDGTTAVSGGFDRLIHIWDVETGEELSTLDGHEGWVTGLRFLAEGHYLLSSSDDTSVRVWDLDTGTVVTNLAGHSGSVLGVSLSPDEQHAITAAADFEVRVWNLYSGSEVRRFVGHDGGVGQVAISPDGKLALTGDSEAMVYIWDVETGEHLGNFTEHTAWVWPLTFGPQLEDGSWTAFSSDFSGGPDLENTILWWNVDTGEVLNTFSGPGDWVQSIAVSPDGKTMVAGSKDNLIHIWDLETGEAIRQLDAHLHATDDPTPPNWVNSVNFSADGRYLASATEEDAEIFLWDTETWEVIHQFESENGHTAFVNYVGFNSDGTQIVTAAGDAQAIIWDVESGDVLRNLVGHTATLQLALFSPDDSLIASAAYDGTIRLWDAATGTLVRQFENGGSVWALAYHPSGETVISGSEDTTVRQWDARSFTLEELFEWSEENRYIEALTPEQRAEFNLAAE